MQVRKRDFQHFLIPLALSGFVVAYAYDDRWSRMTILQFFRVRLIRLHPLLLVGATLGLLFYLFDPFSKMMNRGPLSMVLLAYLASLLLLPSPPIAGRHNESQALNGPAWSLMQQYLGNIVYAFILRRLRLAALGIIFVVSGLGLIWAANAKGSRDGGWDYPKIWMASLCLNVSLEAVVATGKPVVLVLENKRPFDIRWASEQVPAIPEAGYPRTEGGDAVADLFFGDVNAGGKLPASWPPPTAGAERLYYNHNLRTIPKIALISSPVTGTSPPDLSIPLATVLATRHSSSRTCTLARAA